MTSEALIPSVSARALKRFELTEPRLGPFDLSTLQATL
jgi:hypothetical protein